MTISVALAMLSEMDAGSYSSAMTSTRSSIQVTGVCSESHVEPGETPAEAVQRELEEEISWSPSVPLQPWFSDASGTRTAHVFRGELTVPLDQLKLREGQDLRLASLEELRSERIWSDQCLERRPIAPGLNIVMRHLLAEMHDT